MKNKAVIVILAAVSLPIGGFSLAADVVVDESQTVGPFPLRWKGQADAIDHMMNPGEYALINSAFDSTFNDLQLREDEGYFRMSLRSYKIRALMPQSYPWDPEDWDWDALPLDLWQDHLNLDGSLTTIYHLCLGYPEWLIEPEYQHPLIIGNYQYGWLEGDARLPSYQGSEEVGLQFWSELVAEFCNHFYTQGEKLAMTVQAEPNLVAHWRPDLPADDPQKWDDANRYYEAFVAGVNSSLGGADIPVGGLTWATGSMAGDCDLSLICDWARCWRDYCDLNGIRRDFISYHHYWHWPANFDIVADSLGAVFPGEDLWLTEWNYKFSSFLPVQEYKERVIGAVGAVGNLEFLNRALADARHPVLTFFCTIGKFHGYGLCHWNDAGGWDYTGTGHAYRWLGAAGPQEVAVQSDAERVSVKASAGDGRLQALLWNIYPETEQIDLQMFLSAPAAFDFQIWGLDSLHTIETRFKRMYGGQTVIDTLLPMPVGWLIEEGEESGAGLERSLTIDGYQVVYVTLGDNLTEVAEDISPSALAIRLDQNFPNPFNPRTTIRYRLAESGPVFLRVFDVTGRLVRVLRNGDVETAGPHRIAWDGLDHTGRTVAAGTYFYRIEAGPLHQTRRMTLLR